MTELLTAAQMRSLETAAIASGEVTGLELMERAGRGVVEAIFEEWPELAGPGGGAAPAPPGYLEQNERAYRAVVLCGPGNNGGDGFVVARMLKERGWGVEVFLHGDAEKLPADAKVNFERWRELGATRNLLDGSDADNDDLDRALFYSDVVIDSIFGTGLARPIPKFPPLRTFMANSFGSSDLGARDDVRPRVVAIDCPSGLCSDSGKILRPLENMKNRDHFADLTVSFHVQKLGHVLSEGEKHCGKIFVVDIGIVGQTPQAVCETYPLPETALKAAASHKYDHGHALILSGGPGKGGAARLAARGALRIGAGLVTVGCPPEALAENAARLDAVMVAPVGDAAALAEVLKDKRKNALCIGPGLGVSDETGAIVEQGLKSGRAMVLDADALTLMTRDAALFAGLHENCVLTPHAGEFARLFPDIADKLNAPATKGPAYSKVDATREAAARAGCVVLFKGPDTVIAAPDGSCSINSAHYERSAPWLATAGSGDVLAGFITGLLARGFAPMQAAETAAWLHVECALKFGPGLIAEDLPEMLPGYFVTWAVKRLLRK